MDCFKSYHENRTNFVIFRAIDTKIHYNLFCQKSKNAGSAHLSQNIKTAISDASKDQA